MKTLSLRLTMFVVALLFAVGMTAQVDNKDFDLGGGGAGASCKYCGGTMYAGYQSMNCASVTESGSWGRQNCRIESYPEATYCLLDGNDCCVD
jgi:hypothetical protein